jgi:hypothetical protein
MQMSRLRLCGLEQHGLIISLAHGKPFSMTRGSMRGRRTVGRFTWCSRSCSPGHSEDGIVVSVGTHRTLRDRQVEGS